MDSTILSIEWKKNEINIYFLTQLKIKMLIWYLKKIKRKEITMAWVVELINKLKSMKLKNENIVTTYWNNILIKTYNNLHNNRNMNLFK